jgi:hypothetical protein
MYLLATQFNHSSWKREPAPLSSWRRNLNPDQVLSKVIGSSRSCTGTGRRGPVVLVGGRNHDNA